MIGHQIGTSAVTLLSLAVLKISGKTLLTMAPAKNAKPGKKKVIMKQVEEVVTVATLLTKTKIVQPRLSMTDVFNDDILLEELHDLRASKRPVSVVPLTFLENTSRLGFFSSDTAIQPKTLISSRLTAGSLVLQSMANVSAAVLSGEQVRCHAPLKVSPLSVSLSLALSIYPLFICHSFSGAGCLALALPRSVFILFSLSFIS